jgi:hypothetical protein
MNRHLLTRLARSKRAITELMHRSIAALFDHLVGGELQSGWHLETERLDSLEVDDEFELDRLLHRQVRRFRVQISAAR